ncbi:MAG: PDZ domain-containing protein [Planctomycetota bacterium]
MNVPSIKLLCWLTSATLLVGLFLYGHNFFKHQQELQYPVDRDHVQTVLTRDLEVAPDVREGLLYADHVKPTFVDMNWTGKPKPKAVIKNPTELEETGPRYKPLTTVLNILMIMGDTVDPGGSAAYVQYVDTGAIGMLSIGFRLPPPNDFAVVHSIRDGGVEFSFTDGERPNETVEPSLGSTDLLIVPVGPNGVRTPSRSGLPQAGGGRDRPRQTQQIAKNTWELGSEDLEYFEQNISDILTHDVRTATHFDADGKRDGIEIQSVKPGSIAARHGAQDGDVIISINGHKVSSQQEAIQFVKANQDKYSAWEVVVQRLGKIETLVYTDK